MDAFEGQLVDKLRSGDRESFTVLYEQYGKKIYGLGYRMCGNKDDADDIVQKTFIQALTNISSFKKESSIYTWLYTIAKNLCLKALENRKRSTFYSLNSLLNTARSEENEDDFTAVEKKFYISQVKEGCLLGLLRCLPLNQRTAFILNVLLDVKVRDISQIINKSETAVRLLVFRAKRNIKDFLCKNCSLYDRENPCHCEDLIDFSLKQGWIRVTTGKDITPWAQVTAPEIEKEISSLKKITLLYNSIEESQPSVNIIELIREEMDKQEYKIFSIKKVK